MYVLCQLLIVLNLNNTRTTFNYETLSRDHGRQCTTDRREISFKGSLKVQFRRSTGERWS